MRICACQVLFTPRKTMRSLKTLVYVFYFSLIVVGGGCIQQDTLNPLEHIQLRNAEVASPTLRATVTANITEVRGKSAWVEVTWSGFKTPSFDDWICVLAPADSHIKHRTPVKYRRASDAPSHLRTGEGSVKCVIHISVCPALRICLGSAHASIATYTQSGSGRIFLLGGVHSCY
jgi:hypothetical protein